jgi:hypothetical protein
MNRQIENRENKLTIEEMSCSNYGLESQNTTPPPWT